MLPLAEACKDRAWTFLLHVGAPWAWQSSRRVACSPKCSRLSDTARKNPSPPVEGYCEALRPPGHAA